MSVRLFIFSFVLCSLYGFPSVEKDTLQTILHLVLLIEWQYQAPLYSFIKFQATGACANAMHKARLLFVVTGALCTLQGMQC